MNTAIFANMMFCGGIALLIGRQKNFRLLPSFVWGALLSVVGILIIALTPARPPKAPAGMVTVKCSRCNTVSNVEMAQANFECWQCKNVEPMSKAVR